MKDVINYLDDLKEKTGSDYKTAQLLDVSKEAISQIRKRKTIADETALKIAELLGIDAREVLIAAAVARSTGKVKTEWEKISKEATRAAFLAFFVIGPSPYWDAAFRGLTATKNALSGIFDAILCILCKIIWAVDRQGGSNADSRLFGGIICQTSNICGNLPGWDVTRRRTCSA